MQFSDIMKTEVIEPKSGKAKNMVLFLHGYGSNKDDLISIGREWQDKLPDTVFLSPNAPQDCEMMPGMGGYQWFSLRTVQVDSIEREMEREGQVKEVVKNLHAYIDQKLEEYGVDESNLIVVGFSQGSMMTMYTMPRRLKPCAGIVCYSGLLLDGEGLKADDIQKMPVLAMHGAVDDVVPPFNLNLVQKGFDEAGFEVETIMRPGLAHGIDQFGLTRGLDFVLECLGE